MADDDFFGTQDDLDHATERAREWNALRREHVKAGYREGSERGHDAEMQEGFDAGFLVGAKAAADVGYWLGASATVEAFYKSKKRRGEKGVNRGDSEVVQSDIDGLTKAKKALEKRVEGMAEGDVEIDTTDVKDACAKIVVMRDRENGKPKSQ